MIVVMPAGHTPEDAANASPDAFGVDLHRDLIPYVDANYRTLAAPESRAMAGLSMGGAHTLLHGLPRPDRFRWLGVFSMGFRGEGEDAARYADSLRQGAAQHRLVYYAIGRDDFLYPTVAPTRALFDRAGVRYVYNETDGGHTWANWRRYLADFLPRLFR